MKSSPVPGFRHVLRRIFAGLPVPAVFWLFSRGTYGFVFRIRKLYRKTWDLPLFSLICLRVDREFHIVFSGLRGARAAKPGLCEVRSLKLEVRN